MILSYIGIACLIIVVVCLVSYTLHLIKYYNILNSKYNGANEQVVSLMGEVNKYKDDIKQLNKESDKLVNDYNDLVTKYDVMKDKYNNEIVNNTSFLKVRDFYNKLFSTVYSKDEGLVNKFFEVAMTKDYSNFEVPHLSKNVFSLSDIYKQCVTTSLYMSSETSVANIKIDLNTLPTLGFNIALTPELLEHNELASKIISDKLQDCFKQTSDYIINEYKKDINKDGV